MAQHSETDELDPEYLLQSEFTLDDTYDYLKDIQTELRENMEKLMINNNSVQTLLPNLEGTPDYLQEKEHRLVQELLKHDHSYDPRIHPICDSIDASQTAIWELEQEIIDIQKMFDKLKIDMLNVKNNITCLENENNGLERMKETCIDTIEKNITCSIVNNEEIRDAKKLFKEVKNDLATVVELIFPEHLEFKEILGELSSAYMRNRGDQIYVDINTKYIDCIKFMVEADIATYHRNDKNKIRLIDLL